MAKTRHYSKGKGVCCHSASWLVHNHMAGCIISQSHFISLSPPTTTGLAASSPSVSLHQSISPQPQGWLHHLPVSLHQSISPQPHGWLHHLPVSLHQPISPQPQGWLHLPIFKYHFISLSLQERKSLRNKAGLLFSDCLTSKPKDPDILQHLSEAHLQNPMAREDSKWRSVGASGTGTSGQADTAEEVGLDWTQPLEASIQHHTPSPDLEPTGEEKEKPALQQLEARHRSRAETARDQLVQNDQSSLEQSAMARGRWWPMLHRKQWA